MSMIVKHNKKSWTNTERVNTHVNTEDYLLEIHHNDKKHQQQFITSSKLGIETSNARVVTWNSWFEFQSTNSNQYYLKYPISISENGEYWVELLYHNVHEGTYNSAFIMNNSRKYVNLDGSDNFLNRYTVRYQLQKGKHELLLSVNPHTCVLGLVVKKIDYYRADHKLSRENKLTMIEANHTQSDKIGADEFSFDILYDNDFLDQSSLTNYLFDYRDEVTYSVINSKGEMEMIFGGYVSSCSLNSDETVLTVKCAGRLIDGEKRFVMEEVNVGGDTGGLSEEHLAEDVQRFDDYNGAIDYLLRSYETILNSNMKEVFNEKQYECVNIDLTDQSIVSKIKPYDATIESKPEGLYVRNGSGANQMQSIPVYRSDWFNSEPVLLNDFPIFYIEYGMGEPMVTIDANTTAESTGSSDGSVITVRALPSCCCCGGTSYTWQTKTWKNYCPLCGKSGTLKDNPKGVYEHEITCSSCDADYCGICGGDKGSCSRCRKTKLVSASASETSNAGNTSSTDSNKGTQTLSDVFKIVSKEAFKYEYRNVETCSTWSCMEQKGYGDSSAFSEFIFNRLKQAGIGVKIVQYATEFNSNHRSVLYKNTDGEWLDFPYVKYGWSTRYNTALNSTKSSKSGKVIASYNGAGLYSKDNTKTISTGFDKDKPFTCWIRVHYSKNKNSNDINSFYIDFTAQQSDLMHTYRGITPVCLNNIFTTGSVSVVDKVLQQPSTPNVYLRGIDLEYQVLDEALWENNDNTDDRSSCRMIIKNIGFRNGNVINPIDLGSTGKSINEVLKTVVENGNLHLRLVPAQYRSDDTLYVSRKAETTPKFTCFEGEGGNILDISNWSHTPVSDYVNRSVVVYKSKTYGEESSLYRYVESRQPSQVATYGEISDIVSISDDISSQEAYYEAVANPNYDDRTGYSMTVTVVGCPADLKVGDFVEVILEDSTHTDWKEVKSINHIYDIDSSPKLQTKIGLNKPDPVLALRNEYESERRLTKSKKAVFGKTATYNNDDTFKWED